MEKVINKRVLRQVSIRSVLDMAESEEEWNCKDSSGTITKYEMVMAYCIFDQVLDGVVQMPGLPNQEHRPCKRLTPGEKVQIIQAAGNAAYVVLDNQVCAMIQAITICASIWGWKFHEARRTAVQGKFPILRQHLLGWAGSPTSEYESGTGQDPSGWDWAPIENLIQVMKYSDPAKGMLVFITRLPWCVLGPFGPTKISMGALLSVSAQAIANDHVSGQVGEWIYQILPRPGAQPPTRTTAWTFVNPDTEMIGSSPEGEPGNYQVSDDYNWMSSDE